MNQSQASTNSKWPEIKLDIQKAWSKLKDDDLETTKGDLNKIELLLQKSYGQKPETYEIKLKEIFNHSETKFRNPSSAMNK